MTDFLQVSGKTFLVMGVANKKSVAWFIAKSLEEQGRLRTEAVAFFKLPATGGLVRPATSAQRLAVAGGIAFS